METRPTELQLTLAPQRRFEAIDVNMRIAETAGDLLRRHERVLYCSFHTTAGYLDQSLSVRLHNGDDRLSQFAGPSTRFSRRARLPAQRMMDLRTELSDAQKEVSRATATRI